MDWKLRIKDLLVKVTLYQMDKFPAEKLDKELTQFLKDAEVELCKAIRRNGGICYKELLDEYTPKEAVSHVEAQIEDWESMAMQGIKSAIPIVNMLKLSLEFKDLDKMTLSDKILLFDKVIHTEHAAGAFKEYLAEERSIFGVNITEIKREADKEIEAILKGKKEKPDPPQDWRKDMAKIIGEALRKFEVE